MHLLSIDDVAAYNIPREVPKNDRMTVIWGVGEGGRGGKRKAAAHYYYCRDVNGDFEDEL